MKEFSIKELEEIINEGNFDSLIGKIENDFFDCKKEIYDLKNDSSKRELAKDVSSFANLCGGYILINLQTRKSKNRFGDEIERKNLLNQGLVDISQYFNAIRDWIYPEIEGLKIEWKPSNNDESNGILVIQVPRQKEISKPFLVKKVVEAKKHSEIIFGYVERKRDKNDPKKIQDIHKIIRDGLLYDRNIEDRFSALEALLIEINQQQIQKDKQIKKIKR